MIDAIDTIVVSEVMIDAQRSFILPTSAGNRCRVMRRNRARRGVYRGGESYLGEIERNQLCCNRIEKAIGNPDEPLPQTSNRVVRNLARRQDRRSDCRFR